MSETKSIRVLLFPVRGDKDRKEIEYIEDSEYTVEELETVLSNNVLSLTLTDFMDACNNQDIKLDYYWVTYISIID